MINHTALQGRLVDAPVCGQTNGGTDYANFRLAWSKKYKDKDKSDKEVKCFIECKAFGATARFISQYMNQKGQEIVAEGELNTEEWEKDGQKRSKLALIIDRVHFAGKRQDSTSSAPAADPSGGTPVDTDELPF